MDQRIRNEKDQHKSDGLNYQGQNVATDAASTVDSQGIVKTSGG
jgi:hypothetical protein